MHNDLLNRALKRGMKVGANSLTITLTLTLTLALTQTRTLTRTRTRTVPLPLPLTVAATPSLTRWERRMRSLSAGYCAATPWWVG